MLLAKDKAIHSLSIESIAREFLDGSKILESIHLISN